MRDCTTLQTINAIYPRYRHNRAMFAKGGEIPSLLVITCGTYDDIFNFEFQRKRKREREKGIYRVKR